MNHEIENRKKSIVVYTILTSLVALLLVLLLWNKIFITIYAGESGVLFKRWSGTQINDIYTEGFYVLPPWHIMTRYNMRVQETKHNFTVLSKQGLQITIKTSIRYRPNADLVGVLHQRVGPDYLKTVIVPEIEADIRKYFGQLTDEELYTSKKAILSTIYNDAKDQLANKYIILDDLIIRHIEFPKLVQESIQTKIREYHKFKEYEYKLGRAKLEAERKVIEAKGIQKFKDIISEKITPEYLQWKGIEATLKLATSENAKVVVIGSAKDGLPLILNTK